MGIAGKDSKEQAGSDELTGRRVCTDIEIIGAISFKLKYYKTYTEITVITDLDIIRLCTELRNVQALRLV